MSKTGKEKKQFFQRLTWKRSKCEFHHETTYVQTGNSQSYYYYLIITGLLTPSKMCTTYKQTPQWEWNSINIKRKYSQAVSNTFLMHHSLKTCWKYTFHTFRTLINTIGRQASQCLPLYKMVSWFRGQVMYNFNCLLSHERSHLFLFSE